MNFLQQLGIAGHELGATDLTQLPPDHPLISGMVNGVDPFAGSSAPATPVGPAAVPSVPLSDPGSITNALQAIGGTAPAQDPNAPAGQPADLLSGTPYAGGPSPATDPSHPANALSALGTPADPATAPPAAPPGRQRLSALDTFGRLADVFAKVGGAQALYQPSIEANQDRDFTLAERQRYIANAGLNHTLLQQQVDSGTNAAQTAQNTLTGKALAAAKGSGNFATAWPILAKQAGVPDEQAKAIGDAAASNPSIIDGLVGELTEKPKYALNLTPGIDPATGKPAFFQASSDGSPHMLGGAMPQGDTSTVHAGGVDFVLNKHTGQVVGRLTNTQSPDDAANNATKLTVAQMEAAAKARGGKGDDPYTTYTAGKSQIAQMDGLLADLRKDPDLPYATGFAAGAVDSPARQRIMAKIAAIKGLSVPVATSILRASGTPRPAQSEVLATAAGLTSDLGLLRQSTGDYTAGLDRARGGLSSRSDMMDSNAQRLGYANADGSPRSAAPVAAPRPVVAAPRVAPIIPRTGAPAASRATAPRTTTFSGW